MANASAKKQAAANEKQITVLNTGGLVATLLAAILRFLLGRLSTKGLVLSIIAVIPMTLLTRFLVKSGTPKRDQRGELVSPGDDLGAGGVTEYASDVIYLTWLALVLSALFGEKAWFIMLVVRKTLLLRYMHAYILWSCRVVFMQIPAFGTFKLWGFAAPMLGLAGIKLPGFGGGEEAAQEEDAPATATSKRQEKLKKRMERGDARVRQVERKAYQPST